MGSTSEFNRRDLVKRAAALGIIAVPAMGTLSACATGGGGGDADNGTKNKGATSATDSTA